MFYGICGVDLNSMINVVNKDSSTESVITLQIKEVM